MMESKAAALGYDKDDPAPKVLARGMGVSADTLIRIARQSGVPVVESPDLAQSLSAFKPFDFVPEKYWVAVAEIFRFVYETRGCDELH